jgi:hypothetical protein
MKHSKILFLLVVILFSCGKTQEPVETILFQNKAKLTGKVIVTGLADPAVIEVIDSMLMVSNYKAEPLLEVYTTSGVLVKKFLAIGKGPYEILATGDIQFVEDEKAIYVNDLFTKKMLRFTLADMVANPLPKAEIYYALNEEKKTEYLFDKLVIGKGLIIAESRSPQGRLMLFNNKGEPIAYYLKYPKKDVVDQKLTDMSNAGLYACALATNPSRSKLALATYSADMINVMKIGSNSLDSIWSYTNFFPSGIRVMPMGDELVAIHTEKSRTGNLDIAASDKYVYVLYSGKMLKDPTYMYAEKIRVFSWDGKVSYELDLDVPIRRISVSSDDKFLYGICLHEEMGPGIVKYNLNDIGLD